MKISLVPRTTEFYDLFTAAGENALETARLAAARFRSWPEREVKQQEVKRLENKGDDLTRQIIELLNTQYITPFDREDIYQLAKEIDDVVDYIENASDLLGLYKVDQPMEQSLEQCRVLVAAVENLAKALAELRGLRNAERYLVEVKRLEDEGDRVVRDAIAQLFENSHVDPVMIIRWKDIFEALEDAIDACETAADVVGNIVVKNL
jgi:predicted phosphate transport protein (TIGR00153 family)